MLDRHVYQGIMSSISPCYVHFTGKLIEQYLISSLLGPKVTLQQNLKHHHRISIWHKIWGKITLCSVRGRKHDCSNHSKLRAKLLTAGNISSKTFRVVPSQSRYQRFWVALFQPVGQDNSVNEVTCYRLDDPGIKSWWLQDFLHLSRMSLGHSEPPVRWILGLFLRGKVANDQRTDGKII
jgi:hypothetical protein